MELEMGSTPAPGVASRRPRRVAGPCAESQASGSVREAEKVTGEGANHDTRGGRAPLLQHSYGPGVSCISRMCLIRSWRMLEKPPGVLKGENVHRDR